VSDLANRWYSFERLPGPPVLQLGAVARGPGGYRVDEFLLRGEARSFRLVGAPRVDGRWDATAQETAEVLVPNQIGCRKIFDG
jgi:hypothetical protein